MSDEWHYSHKNNSGYDVNAYGYDKNGVFRGSAPFNNNIEQPIFRKKEKSKAGNGLIGILLIVIAIFVVNLFKYNWVSIVAIIATILLCTIFCHIAKKKLVKSRLAKILAIIITIGIIIGIVYLGPLQGDGNFERWRKTSISLL